MEKIKVYIEKEKIDEKISELAKKIDNDYKSSGDLVVICILKGAVYFYCDLTKKIKRNITEDFMKVSSYVGKESTGFININVDLGVDIENKDVLIVEDIIDTGLTLTRLKDYLNSKNPNSVKIAVLLDKKCKRTQNIDPDYCCFEIEDKFVVGYGLDYDEKYRNLPYIGYI